MVWEEAKPRFGATLDDVKRISKPSCLERGRRPTDTSKVVTNPRISAGSTVVFTGVASSRTLFSYKGNPQPP
jgi:hypothetical protein